MPSYGVAATGPLPGSPVGTRPAPGTTGPGSPCVTSAVVVRSIFFFGLSSLLALYVGIGLHGGRQLGEAALTTMLVAGAVGTITGGRLADRFGRLPVIRASFAVTALGLLPIALTGFALNRSFSLTVTLGQDYLPTRIGTSSGVTLGLAISVGGLLTPALGALADATSLQLAVTVLVAFPLTRLALALRLRQPRSPAAGTRPASRPVIPRHTSDSATVRGSVHGSACGELAQHVGKDAAVPVVGGLAGVSMRTVAVNSRVPPGPSAATVTVRGTSSVPARPRTV